MKKKLRRKRTRTFSERGVQISNGNATRKNEVEREEEGKGKGIFKEPVLDKV